VRRFLARRATDADARQLFEWANEPSTRAVSFHADPITWESHLGWLARRLSDPDTQLYVIEDETGAPIGQVRFDLADARATISVSVGEAHRGRGAGSAAIEAGVGALRETGFAGPIVALIKPDNARSVSAFTAAGFSAAGEVVVQGAVALRYERRAAGAA
jgi:RimJ/RimL family protein N-acetyltransferase